MHVYVKCLAVCSKICARSFSCEIVTEMVWISCLEARKAARHKGLSKAGEGDRSKMELAQIYHRVLTVFPLLLAFASIVFSVNHKFSRRVAFNAVHGGSWWFCMNRPC